MKPEEAELAKLFTNAYRYIKFAAANQLFMTANDFGVDYERVRAAVSPRLSPGRGPSRTGPCCRAVLVERHNAARVFNNNNFALGLASMQVNEGLPLYLVSRAGPEVPA